MDPARTLMVLKFFELSFLIVVVSATTTNPNHPQYATTNLDDSNNTESALNDLKNTIQLVREEINAMIDNRQQDYNSLEESLKRTIEKNTELAVLRNEVRQLRKEVSVLRGGGGNGGNNGNEAKNERLKVKWLASAVTELKTELTEVLRARNASEEIAQHSRMQSELELLRGDVSQVGRGIRDLGGRLTRIEASLGTIRLDICAVKERAGQLTRIFADVTSQLSTVQIEMKSFKCQTTETAASNLGDYQGSTENNDVKHSGMRSNNNDYYNPHNHQQHHHDKRYTPSRISASVHHIEERLMNLEHKISVVARKRGILEKRVVYENLEDDSRKRIVRLEKSRDDMETRVSNISKYIENSVIKVDETIIGLLASVEDVEEKMQSNRSEEKRQVARLEINAARKYAELSLTREELMNLRRTVQALSVSASKLQEKSDIQQESLMTLKKCLVNVTREQERQQQLQLFHVVSSTGVKRPSEITKELQHAKDDYKSMIESLPGNCDYRDGLTMLAPGTGGGGQAYSMPLLVSCRNGWIVVARRIDGIVDFDRTWSEYAAGFGSPINEVWIGNEALHRLTRDNCTRLRIDITDIYGNDWYAEYDNFHVDSEDTGYKLYVSGYSGNATDAFSYQNGMSFSAKDRDMDISSADCAANYRGGWWFSHCQHANLNGRYSLGLTWYRSDVKQWMAVIASVMSVQRKSQC